MPQVFNVNVTDMTATFAYNPASQMTVRARDNDAYVLSQAAGQKLYTVNGLNQYTAVAGAAYAYDSNGSLTSDGATTFGYDAENRLARLVIPGLPYHVSERPNRRQP